jgi:anti-anti-sigma factor
MLRIDIHAVYPNVTMHCSGKIVLGLEAETLRFMVTSRNEKCLTLDLSGIDALDAAGLGLLVELQCWATQENKALQILKPSRCVRRLITLTHLHSVLQLGDCEKSDTFDQHGCEAYAMGAQRAMSA